MKTTIAIAVLALLSPLQVPAQTSGDSAAADKSPHQGGFVRVNGIRLHYLDWGGSGDPLLLLAGQGDDAHVFDLFAPKFIDHFYVIALTRRGFGESDKPKDGYGTSSLIEDIRQFLDALKIKKTTIVGHSVAGTELTAFASLYPKRVNRLVYLDAAWNYTCKGGEELPSWETPPQPSEAAAPILEPWKLVSDAAEQYQPTYSKVKAPALAIYAPPERHPEKPRVASAERRKEMDAWWVRNRYPCTRKSIEQFRQEVPRAQIVELPNGYHYLFLGPAQVEVVRLTREFLLNEKSK
jgi:pimeloyl-ACP methyl ester carboxylesterase